MSTNLAQLNDKRCHIAFMDSRAGGLQEKIDERNEEEYLGIREHKGASLHHLSRLVSSHLEKYPFDVVYIIGGACDITTKQPISTRISFNWDPPSNLEKQLTSTLTEESEFMVKSHPASKVIFCPLVGVDLERVVNEHEIKNAQHDAVDQAGFRFNEKIFEIKRERKVFSLSLHRSVHRSMRGKERSFYQQLAECIHLSEALKDKWVSELLKAVKIN